MEQELLGDPTVINDPSLAAALRRHKAVIDRCYYYRAFTDAIKARAPRLAAKLFLESPVSSWLIALESARQAPLILGKSAPRRLLARRSLRRAAYIVDSRCRKVLHFVKVS